MFSMFQRNRRLDLGTHILRICDLTAPNMPQLEENRQDKRYNRTIPVVIHPWDDEKPNASSLTVCLTKDLSDHGMGLIASRQLGSSNILIGFWLSDDTLQEPWFFHAQIKDVERTGAGLWRLGTELVKFMNRRHRKDVVTLFEATKALLSTKQSVRSS